MYVLVIMLMGSVHSVEFKTQDACLEAQGAIRRDLGESGLYMKCVRR